MHRWFRSLWLVVLIAVAPAYAADQNIRVGVGTGCTHADLLGAFNAIRAQTGTHTVRINKGSYALPDGLSYNPSVSQTAVFLEGGYDNCTAPTPTGNVANDSDRAVLSGTGGLAFPVLALNINGLVQSFQIRRIVIRDGDAGGLYVGGQASVLLGLGTSIKFNQSAGNGGGVMLVGSQLSSVSNDRIDLYIDEGAEIRNNSAVARGGGVYCGDASSNNRHASIVFRDGIIGYNEANEGAAFYCRGSLELGGGFQPRPAAGRVAWIIGNQTVSTGSGVSCAAGFGTLDAVLPVEADGFRHLGAAAGSNGLVAITANGGDGSPALCLLGSRSRSAIGDPAPVGQSRFRLRNLYVSDQIGTGFLGLSTGDALELIVEPSSDTVSCTFFSATPCVRFFNNTVSTTGTPEGRLLHANGGSFLQLRRAMIDSNSLRPDLAFADDDADLIIMGSIVDSNTVAVRTVSPATSALFAARYGASVDVRNSTVITRSALTQFFRLGWAPFGSTPDLHAIAYAQASAFASTVAAPITIGFESATPNANFQRYWCGYFADTTTNFSGHTVVNNPSTGGYSLAANFGVEADYAPAQADLRDVCTAPSGTLNRDFYGRPYDVLLTPGSPLTADIGAVEDQGQDPIFGDGFEN